MRSWRLVLPVKDLGAAKSRLVPPVGVQRADLALAFAFDATAAALAVGVPVLVTTSSSSVVAAFRAEWAGDAVEVLEDAPPGLNEAVSFALGRCGDGPVGVMTADLPALRGSSLQRALLAAEQVPYAVVPDAAGTGTTLLAALDPARVRPSFGPGSCAAHLADGAHVLEAGVDLRLDVDTAEDLEAARALGLGPATRALLASAA
ncbi:2-phospho-L-lactate guanylyltransferase [Motilibacter rhizosphaerae]|uniref:Phosphoenolpyruvate guanylyltransferase n=1 Tax=Motilibacter rhizosphaerae TaxID=598652 RepID=A0A4Q7NPP3_9ACTN|nr:2-phospho-L-lactate guanylyltransferase [Motilibacter rhizosphaerae]RZS87018.1 2-phospho-L-lactate guanylyltransferase [Motilibacter rhizosphaerae]